MATGHYSEHYCSFVVNKFAMKIVDTTSIYSCLDFVV